jgi:hypothetical protein
MSFRDRDPREGKTYGGSRDRHFRLATLEFFAAGLEPVHWSALREYWGGQHAGPPAAAKAALRSLEGGAAVGSTAHCTPAHLGALLSWLQRRPQGFGSEATFAQVDNEFHEQYAQLAGQSGGYTLSVAATQGPFAAAGGLYHGSHAPENPPACMHCSQADAYFSFFTLICCRCRRTSHTAARSCGGSPNTGASRRTHRRPADASRAGGAAAGAAAPGRRGAAQPLLAGAGGKAGAQAACSTS